MDAHGARIVMATFGLALAAVGCVELVPVDAAPQPLSFFDDIRFSEPVGYMNGNVAMWTMGMLACLSTAGASRPTAAAPAGARRAASAWDARARVRARASVS